MWETIEELFGACNSARLRVPGGWLVRSEVNGVDGKHPQITQTFIMDPAHTWVLERAH